MFLDVCLYIHTHLEMDRHIHFYETLICFTREVPGEKVKMDPEVRNIFI